MHRKHELYLIPNEIKAREVTITRVSALEDEKKIKHVGIGIKSPTIGEGVLTITIEEAEDLVDSLQMVLHFHQAKKDNAN